MEVVTLSPLYVTALPWKRDAKSSLLTLVCKATFDLQPGEMRLSQQQEPIHEHDRREDDPGRSVHAPSDLWPFKQRADITLVGHAYAPRSAPVRSLVARLVSGSVDKSIAIHGDRSPQTRSDPQPFTRMALRWDRAAGGPGTSNPSGLAASADRLPNLEPVRLAEDTIPPIGFGPIAQDWPQRRARLKASASGWSASEPLPDDFDPLFFNAAPSDQQPAALRDDQPLVLENLHPDHPRLSTRLPGLRPQAFVDRGGGQAQELELRPDSLWIDTDRARCTVTWRAHFPLSQPDEPGRVLVALTSVRQQLSWEDMKRLEVAVGGDRAPKPRSRPEVPSLVPEDEDDEQNDTMMMARQAMLQPRSQPRRAPPPLPSSPGAAPPPAPSIPGLPPPPPIPSLASAVMPAPPPLPASPHPSTTATLPATPPPLPSAATAASAAPPTAPPPAAPPPPAKEPPRIRFDPETTNTDFFVIGEHTPIFDATPAWLAQVSPSGPAVPAVTAQAVPAPPPAPATVLPPLQAPPPSPSSAAQPAPPATSKASTPAMPAQVMPAQVMPAQVVPAQVPAAPISSGAGEPRSPWAAGSPSASGKIPTSAPVPIKSTPPPAPEPARSRTPTLTGSPRPAASTPQQEVLDLIWFDPEALPGIRARWGSIIDELEFSPLDPKHDLPVDDPAAARDRHHAFGVLTQATATDGPGVSRAMLEAISDKGRFTPPLLVIGGDLRFPFDEIEMLKAAAAAAKPLARDDKKLGELLEMVNELIGTPLLQGAPGMVESLLRDLGNAVQQSKRALPVKYLDTHLERVLLEQRRYQKRTVFGGPSLRTLLVPARESTAVPAYLPEKVADKLPLVTQMKVKVIAYANPSQDQYESHPHALRIVALGRVMAVEGWRR